jgi:hypothetical protein
LESRASEAFYKVWSDEFVGTLANSVVVMTSGGAAACRCFTYLGSIDCDVRETISKYWHPRISASGHNERRVRRQARCCRIAEDRLADVACQHSRSERKRQRDWLHSRGLYHADWSMSLAPIAAVEYLEPPPAFARNDGLGMVSQSSI